MGIEKPQRLVDYLEERRARAYRITIVGLSLLGLILGAVLIAVR